MPRASWRLALVAMLALVSATAAAREPSAEERGALVQTIERFNAAMRDADYAYLVDRVPPKIMAHIAGGAGIDVDTAKKQTLEVMAQAMTTVTVTDFGMDLDAAETRELADGTPFLLIPTTTDMQIADTRIRASTQTLALLETEGWYLVRIDDPSQVAILKSVYPQFEPVEFPSGSVETLP